MRVDRSTDHRGKSRRRSQATRFGGNQDSDNYCFRREGEIGYKQLMEGTNGTRICVVEFSTKPDVGVREGQVGPTYDRITSNVLRGGGHQVQFMNTSRKPRRRASSSISTTP